MFKQALVTLATISLGARAWSDYYVGALYTLDNNPDRNGLLITAVDRMGGLTYAGVRHTGGKGPEAGTLDLVAGQDGVVVAGQYLFAVNTGSNSVSMFAIDEYE